MRHHLCREQVSPFHPGGVGEVDHEHVRALVDLSEQDFRDLLRRSDQAVSTGPDIGIRFQAVEFLFVFGNEDNSAYDLPDFVVVTANPPDSGI